jgi:hypothetical protein
MMSCRAAEPILGYDPITSSRSDQMGDFEVARGGGSWVATGGCLPWSPGNGIIRSMQVKGCFD